MYDSCRSLDGKLHWVLQLQVLRELPHLDLPPVYFCHNRVSSVLLRLFLFRFQLGVVILFRCPCSYYWFLFVVSGFHR